MANENGDEARFCSRYFISPSTMKMTSGMRKQLEAELVQCGFILEHVSRCSLNARDPGIIHAVVVAGLYPLIGRLLAPTKNCKRAIVETAGGNKVWLHSHSTNFKQSLKKCSRPLIIFEEITRGDCGLHIRNCTVVGQLPLLLLAKEIVVAPSSEMTMKMMKVTMKMLMLIVMIKQGVMIYQIFSVVRKLCDRLTIALKLSLIVDFLLSRQLLMLLKSTLRERLSSAILFKVRHPRKLLLEHLGASLYAIACSLSYDGMSGITLPLEPVDSLASMISAADIGHPNYGKKTGMNQLPKHNPTYYGHQNFVSHHRGGGMNRSQKLPPQSSTAVAREPAIYGMPLSKGNCSKRQRGNGLR